MKAKLPKPNTGLYLKMEIGDEIEIAYAKHAKWIVSIYRNALHIENSPGLQRYG